MRETREEVGLIVTAIKPLGKRVHPATGRTMVYVAYKVLGGTAYVADEDEIAKVEWCDRAKLGEYVPYPFFGPVRSTLTRI